MRKLYLLKTMLLLCAIIVGSGSMWAETKTSWVKTAPADLVTGDVVAIVDQTSVTAMSNDNGTSSAPAATSVTLNADKSEITSTVAETLEWVVTVTTEDNVRSYQFGVGENYLYTTTSNNGLRVGPTTTNSHNVCGIYNNNGTDFVTIYDGSKTRYVGVYNSQDWRSYTSINTNIEKCVTAFYKKVTVDNGKTDIATIGTDLTPTEVNVEDEGTFAVGMTFASQDATDYEVTWTSSDTEVLDVDNSGYYQAYAAGSVIVTVKVEPVDDDTYNAVSRQFTVTVTDPNAPGTLNNPYTVAQAIAATPTSGTLENVYIKGVVSSFYNTNIMGDGTNYRYYISDKDGEDELLVFRGKGKDNVAFSDVDDLQIDDEIVIYGGLKIYSNAPEVVDSYIITLSRVEKADAEFSFGETTAFSVDKFLEFEAPTLTYAEGFDGSVVYKSSDVDVAEVDMETGAITVKAKGETTISASSLSTDNFKAGYASYTLTVTANADVNPVGPSATGGKFVKVTKTEDITDNDDSYLIVYEEEGVAFDGSLSTLDAGNNVISVTLDKEKNEIAATNELLNSTFAINVTSGTVKSASGYYIGVSTYSNGLRQTNSEESPYTNDISIDESGNLLISNTIEDKGTMTLYFNPNSGDNNYRFRFYKGESSTAKPVQLYKYVPGETPLFFDVEVGEAGYKTLVSTVGFTAPENAAAYIVTAQTSDEITLTKVAQVPAGEPVILKGEGTVSLVIDEYSDGVKEEFEAANLLKISDENTKSGVYVLYNGDEGVGFYEWTGGSLGAGRVYLPAANGARKFLAFNFGGETTGIKDVNREAAANGNYYNLNGQRVAQPAKGLYIVNGKKYIVK
ncbi:MAG: Ig-like domain-containing protein [Prevotella sp.]|nr:Ig-like domain-containing protein [Prevotella sp.]